MVSSLILLRSLRVYILKQLFFSISVNSGFRNIYLAAFASRYIFSHYSPRFQRIFVKYNIPAFCSLPHSRFCLVTQCFSPPPPPPTNGHSHLNHIPFQLFYHPTEMTNHLSANWKWCQFSRKEWAPQQAGFCFAFINTDRKNWKTHYALKWSTSTFNG